MKKIIAAALLLIGISDSLRALDLTPHEISQSSDAVTAKRYFFQDEEKRFSFRIDNKMLLSGGGNSVAFRFLDLKNAAMKMSRSQMNPGVPFNEKNAETYRSIARSFLAGEATSIQLEAEQANAVSINGWTSHQFVFTYNLSGFPHRRSVTFLNFNETEQFIVDLSAEDKDYEKAYARGYRVLNSLSDSPVDAAGPT